MIEVHVGGIPPEYVPQLGGPIAEALKNTDPDRAQAILGGLIGNIVGNLPDDHWKEIVKLSEAPCSQEGCTCHIYQKKVYDALEMLRQTWKEVVAKREPENPDEK